MELSLYQLFMGMLISHNSTYDITEMILFSQIHSTYTHSFNHLTYNYNKIACALVHTEFFLKKFSFNQMLILLYTFEHLLNNK